MAVYPELPVAPDSNNSVTHNPDVRKAKFGGYTQTGPASMNNDAEVWNLAWTKCRYSKVKPVFDLLKERGGWQCLTWRTPDGVLKIFRCETYGLTYPHGIDPNLPEAQQFVELTVTLTQEFR